jgi:formamidopyrimidine-DNA glycosylase
VPELPDVTVYAEALGPRILGHRLERVSIRGPFLLRTASPPVQVLEGRSVTAIRRMGKRIAIGVEGDLWLVLHLMIAGRLHWRTVAPKPTDRRVLAAFTFDNGVLTFTEGGTEHRAAVHVIAGEEGLDALDAGGIDVMSSTPEQFAEMLRSENHTLKRALTDPRLFSGIGNAYSDEILHRAQMSPVAMTGRMTDADAARLHTATREVLTEWIDRLRSEAGSKFPEGVTAFRPEMAVHGKYGKLCPRCGAKVQRIRYASNETNYCAVCQTGGKLLADRGLSRLLHEDWPRNLEEMEALKRR